MESKSEVVVPSEEPKIDRLSTLTPVVVDKIIEYLDTASILALSKTCQSLRKVIKKNELRLFGRFTKVANDLYDSTVSMNFSETSEEKDPPTNPFRCFSNLVRYVNEAYKIHTNTSGSETIFGSQHCPWYRDSWILEDFIEAFRCWLPKSCLFERPGPWLANLVEYDDTIDSKEGADLQRYCFSYSKFIQVACAALKSFDWDQLPGMQAKKSIRNISDFWDSGEEIVRLLGVLGLVSLKTRSRNTNRACKDLLKGVCHCAECQAPGTLASAHVAKIKTLQEENKMMFLDCFSEQGEAILAAKGNELVSLCKLFKHLDFGPPQNQHRRHLCIESALRLVTLDE